MYFSVLFWAVFGLFYLVYFISVGKTNVHYGDGLNQHLTTLVYIGEYLREFFHNLFVGHQFVLPMFDFSIGYGMDILTTLHYYGLGDPLNFLSVFFQPEDTESLFAFLFGLRMFIAGEAFLIFMKNKTASLPALLMGAMGYSFSAYALMLAIKHPFFMIGLMYAPLVFAGIERILARKSPLLFIISLALAVGSNFYFAYMICIYMVIYAALIYFPKYRKKGAGYFFKTIRKFAGYTAIAMLLPMIIFLPQIYHVLSLNRLNVDNYIGIFHSLSYYESFLGYFTNSVAGSRDLFLGFGGIVLLCIFAAMIRAKMNRTILIALALSIVFCLFPIFGSALNGLAYVSNRFCWILVLIANACFVVNYDTLFSLNAAELKRLALCLALYTALVYISSSSMNSITLTMVVLALLAVAVLFGTLAANDKRLPRRVMACLMLVGMLIQINNVFNYTKNNYLQNFMDRGTPYKYIGEQSISSGVKAIGDTSEFYRYENNTISNSNANIFNDAVLSDMNSTSFFFSMPNQNISNFIREMGLLTSLEQIYNNLNSRSILQSLFGCKNLVGGDYFDRQTGYEYTMFEVETQNDTTLIDNHAQIGFCRGVNAVLCDEVSSYPIWQYEDYLPMGYTYDAVVPLTEYQGMNSAQKQSTLLVAAHTDKPVDLPVAEQAAADVVQHSLMDYLVPGDGYEIVGHEIYVYDESIKLQFTVPSVPNAEYSLLWSGMDFEDISKYDMLERNLENHPERKDEIQKLSYKRMKWSQRREQPSEGVHIYMKSDNLGAEQNIYYRTNRDAYYSGYNNFLVRLGYTSAGMAEDMPLIQFELSFEKAGIYSFDDLALTVQPLEYLQENVANLKQNILENVEMDDNFVGGTIRLTEPKLLATQIPYSEGWRVTVDGEEAELINVNTMFCGVMLDAGEHTVEFRYTTPHWLLAVALSGAGLVMLLVVALYWKIKSKKSKSIAKNLPSDPRQETERVGGASAAAAPPEPIAPQENASAGDFPQF